METAQQEPESSTTEAISPGVGEATSVGEASGAGDGEAWKSRMRPWLTVSVVVLTFVLTVSAAVAANRAGWIPHRQDTTVYVGVGEWSVGEYRNCVALPESNGSMIFLGCVGRRRAEMSPDVWPVTYWGQVRRKDMFELVHQDPVTYTWRWRCRRRDSSLTCWAVN